MDYEKEYKGARARCEWQLANGMITKECATDLFRELAESEDEKIRKEITAVVDAFVAGKSRKERMLAWLENQKEYIEDIRQYAYNKGLVDAEEKQKPSTPEDIAAAYQMGLAEGRKEQKSAELTSMDDAIEACMLRYLQSAASRKDDDEIMEDTRKYKQELVGLVQKPAEWSEEDEKMLERIIERGSCLIPSGEDALLPAHIEWLKSIHSHWKPSEEQMKHLHNVMIGWHPDTADCQALHSLYEDLKKL